MSNKLDTTFTLGVGILLGILITSSLCYFILEEPIEQAELVMVFDSWGDTPDGVTLFDFTIINYGSVEAKDVWVECRIYNDKEEVVYELHDLMSNIASTSSTFETISEKTGLNIDDRYSGTCRIIPSDNYEAMNKRLPEFNRNWED